MGLRLVLADIDEPRLAKAGKQIAAIAGEQNVITVPTDVSKMEEVTRLKERAYDAFGEVSCALILFICAHGRNTEKGDSTKKLVPSFNGLFSNVIFDRSRSF
jgi:hypothetical protein